MAKRRKQNPVECETMNNIRKIEDKYGLIVFRMGLTHLVDVGVRHLTDENIEETIAEIMEKEAQEKDSKRTPVITSAFQCEVVCCAGELAQFSIWSLFRYIKKNVVVD